MGPILFIEQLVLNWVMLFHGAIVNPKPFRVELVMATVTQTLVHPKQSPLNGMILVKRWPVSCVSTAKEQWSLVMSRKGEPPAVVPIGKISIG